MSFHFASITLRNRTINFIIARSMSADFWCPKNGSSKHFCRNRTVSPPSWAIKSQTTAKTEAGTFRRRSRHSPRAVRGLAKVTLPLLPMALLSLAPFHHVLLLAHLQEVLHRRPHLMRVSAQAEAGFRGGKTELHDCGDKVHFEKQTENGKKEEKKTKNCLSFNYMWFCGTAANKTADRERGREGSSRVAENFFHFKLWVLRVRFDDFSPD